MPGRCYSVTTMIERWFGVPWDVFRDGRWASMKPGEQNLYLYLMHESERYSTRELRRTDDELSQLTEMSSRTFCNSRKKLQELKLIVCARGAGNVYLYKICDPRTGMPWPGDPKKPIEYKKVHPDSAPAETPEVSFCGVSSAKHQRTDFEADEPFEKHGVPLKWGT